MINQTYTTGIWYWDFPLLLLLYLAVIFIAAMLIYVIKGMFEKE